MPNIMVASSPIEIDAKADAAELAPDARDVARRMFHHLTDRLGKAVIALELQHRDWPEHRFYFGADATAMDALLGRLAARPAVLDVTDGVRPDRQPDLVGLYALQREGSFTGILVGHQTHEGLDPA